MDIDEFIDRELSELDLDTSKAEKSEFLSAKKADSSSLTGIRADLKKGNLEQAEQSYVELWQQLMQQKLKWNKELYEQLTNVSRQFSSMLTESYNEMKKKSAHVSELIARARNAIREGKKDMAFRLYSDVQEISNSIPNVFFEDKKAIQDQIMSFYKELASTTDAELVKKVSSLMQEINQSIEKISSFMKSDDIANAAASYVKCVELYNQVPEGFLMSKNPAGLKLLEIYRNLGISMEISNLQKQLGQTAQFQQFASMPIPASKPQLVRETYEKQDIRPKAFAKLETPKKEFKEEKSYIEKSLNNKNIETNSMLLNRKVERAKKNIKKGFYNEALKDVEEALQMEPNDVEARALRAQIKTLQ